jgi:hypothetical protein
VSKKKKRPLNLGQKRHHEFRKSISRMRRAKVAFAQMPDRADRQYVMRWLRDTYFLEMQEVMDEKKLRTA